MKQKIAEKIKAIELRKRGYSLNEILREINVAKSSVSVWVRDVVMNEVSKRRLAKKISKAQFASQIAIKNKTAKKIENANQKANDLLKNLVTSEEQQKILCAMIYYCEGRKSTLNGIAFTNSDVNLVKLFLVLLRTNFLIDEKKLRVCVHLHDYHNSKKQLKFWSKVTDIPLKQFIHPHFKKSQHKYQKAGYEGCISVRYGSNSLAREIKAIAELYMGLSVNGKPTDSKSVTPRSSRGGPA